ncbi:SDR family oxidoreductase [Granulosicoccus sp.]|nr:SDR family oxidoreductase [Granulosicoccus sp.]
MSSPYPPLESLDGKVALVTGATRRIGRATSLGLARHGADLLITARSANDEIQEVARGIESLGRRATIVMADVTKEADVARVKATLMDTYGRIDVLVNNAAIRRQAPFLALTLAEWREITANCVVPGKIGGERSATSGASPDMGAKILLGREGEVAEAAGMIVAMCLPQARFMTGQNVHVSGGLYLP